MALPESTDTFKSCMRDSCSVREAVNPPCGFPGRGLRQKGACGDFHGCRRDGNYVGQLSAAVRNHGRDWSSEEDTICCGFWVHRFQAKKPWPWACSKAVSCGRVCGRVCGRERLGTPASRGAETQETAGS